MARPLFSLLILVFSLFAGSVAGAQSLVQCLPIFTLQYATQVLKPIEMDPSFRGEEDGTSPALEDTNVFYLHTYAERAPYEWRIERGELMKKENGAWTPLFTNEGTHSLNPLEFIATTTGELYGMTYREQKAAEDAHDAGIHHSTFMAGGSVGFAGNVRVVLGRILVIDNSSGHYLPSVKATLDFLDYLTSLGVDLSHTEINIKDFEDAISKSPALYRRYLQYVPEYAMLAEQLQMFIRGGYKSAHYARANKAVLNKIRDAIEKEFASTGQSNLLYRHFLVWDKIKSEELRSFLREMARLHGVPAPQN